MERMVRHRGEEFKVFIRLMVYPEYGRAISAFADAKMDHMGKVPTIPEEWFNLLESSDDEASDEDSENLRETTDKDDEGEEAPRIEDEPRIESERADSKVDIQEMHEEGDENDTLNQGIGYLMQSLDDIHTFIESFRKLETQRSVKAELKLHLVDINIELATLYISKDIL